MKNPDRKTVSQLVELPNIGNAMADSLQLIGIDHPKKLIGKNPFKLFETLCAVSGTRHDPCVIDVFMAVIHFMEGGDPLPWWSFTDERKKAYRPTKSIETRKLKQGKLQYLKNPG
ncbi:MAG: mitomycin resistance protein [Candidatus Schekmanbacteria bacterium RBG_13_48_7]|uniref:Mitomycin resistance protein n=1 Tax=Candidatus Schekmanbacteria bacterium RBG_13_48_7 TaxID=1817878 RepID=A0A1F7S032_9BACT|nr:MAG: mitomycin resistance protein [Candidatus Schekmanbacteria bacterium RBG_13_48_7]